MQVHTRPRSGPPQLSRLPPPTGRKHKPRESPSLPRAESADRIRKTPIGNPQRKRPSIQHAHPPPGPDLIRRRLRLPIRGGRGSCELGHISVLPDALGSPAQPEHSS